MKKRNSIKSDLRFSILFRDNFTCQYCQTKLRNSELQIDHLVPISKGGSNNKINLITSCVECNRLKRNSFWFPESKLESKSQKDWNGDIWMVHKSFDGWNIKISEYGEKIILSYDSQSFSFELNPKNIYHKNIIESVKRQNWSNSFSISNLKKALDYSKCLFRVTRGFFCKKVAPKTKMITFRITEKEKKEIDGFVKNNKLSISKYFLSLHKKNLETNKLPF